MNRTNPYTAKENSSGRSTPDSATLAGSSALDVANLAVIGLRLLGVLFAADGVGGLIANSVAVFTEYRQMIDAGVEPYVNAVTLGLVLSSFFYTVLGVYFVTNGQSILRILLMTDASSNHEPTEDDVSES